MMRLAAIAMASVLALAPTAQAQTLTLEDAITAADNPAVAVAEARVDALPTRGRPGASAAPSAGERTRTVWLGGN